MMNSRRRVLSVVHVVAVLVSASGWAIGGEDFESETALMKGLARGLVPSLVRVEITLQVDKDGMQPELGWWPPRRGEWPYYSPPVFGRDYVKDERPVEVPGFVEIGRASCRERV